MTYPLLLVLAVCVGVLISLQAGMMVGLQHHLGSAVLAAFASFLVGSLALLGYLLVSGRRWPAVDDLVKVPLWLWCAGFVGALLFTLMVMLAPRLGAGTLMALVVAGQLGTALVLDHFGALGFAQHPTTLLRVGGALLIVVGAFLVQAR